MRRWGEIITGKGKEGQPQRVIIITGHSLYNVLYRGQCRMQSGWGQDAVRMGPGCARMRQNAARRFIGSRAVVPPRLSRQSGKPSGAVDQRARSSQSIEVLTRTCVTSSITPQTTAPCRTASPQYSPRYPPWPNAPLFSPALHLATPRSPTA